MEITSLILLLCGSGNYCSSRPWYVQVCLQYPQWRDQSGPWRFRAE